MTRPRIEALFADEQGEAVLDLVDRAWHDACGLRDLEVPPAVLDDVLLLAVGDLAMLVRVARQAMIDVRDVRVAAAHRRETAT